MFFGSFEACGDSLLQRRVGAEHDPGRSRKGGSDEVLRPDEPANAPAGGGKGLCSDTDVNRQGDTRFGRNLLPAEQTVIVLSHMPGRVAIRTCSSSS